MTAQDVLSMLPSVIVYIEYPVVVIALLFLIVVAALILRDTFRGDDQ